MVRDTIKHRLPEHHLLVLIKRYMGIFNSHVELVMEIFGSDITSPRIIGSEWVQDAQTVVVYTMLHTLCEADFENIPQAAVEALNNLAQTIEKDEIEVFRFDEHLAQALAHMPASFYTIKSAPDLDGYTRPRAHRSTFCICEDCYGARVVEEAFEFKLESYIHIRRTF